MAFFTFAKSAMTRFHVIHKRPEPPRSQAKAINEQVIQQQEEAVFGVMGQLYHGSTFRLSRELDREGFVTLLRQSCAQLLHAAVF